MLPRVKHKMSGSYVVGLVALCGAVSPACSTTSTSCAQIGGSLELSKAEVYQTLRAMDADGGEPSSDAAVEPDAGLEPDAGGAAEDAAGTEPIADSADASLENLACPTSEAISLYLTLRHQRAIPASAISTPVDHSATCLYPVLQVMCEP